MNRRDFVKIGCGAVAFGVGMGAFSYFSMDEPGDARAAYGAFHIAGLPDALNRVLFLASLAPSGHNAQPWQVKIKEERLWTIGSNPERWLPAVDPDNRELLLSIGAFMENISLAAKCYDYEVQFKQTGQDAFSGELVEIKLLLSGGGKSAGRVEQLEERRTLRKNLQRKKLAAEDIAFLTEDIENIAFYPRESPIGREMSRLVLLANERQVERAEVQKELAEWIRFNKRQAEQYGNGMTPDSMEMSGIIRWYATHFMSKADVYSETFKRQTLQMVKEQVEDCAGWFVFSSEGNAMKELINAGRQIEKMWLRVKGRHIAFQPMTQPLEEAAVKKALQTLLKQENPVQFIVRSGYVEDYPPPVSLRMDMEKIILA